MGTIILTLIFLVVISIFRNILAKSWKSTIKIIIGIILLGAGVIFAVHGYNIVNDERYKFAQEMGYDSSEAFICMMGGAVAVIIGLTLLFSGALSSNSSNAPSPKTMETPEERQERLNMEREQRQLQEEELRRKLIENEQQKEEARKKRVEFWHRHRIHILMALVAVIVIIVTICIVYNKSKERAKLQAERERQELYERQLHEKALRDEAQRKAHEEAGNQIW